MFHRKGKAKKQCSKCGKGTEKADREVCKKCGSVEFVDAGRTNGLGSRGFESDPPPPPLCQTPVRRPRLRSPGSGSSPLHRDIGAWTFHDEETLREEEGIGTWAPVVRSWTFHTEAEVPSDSPSTAIAWPLRRITGGESNAAHDGEEHASTKSPGIGSWGFRDKGDKVKPVHSSQGLVSSPGEKEAQLVVWKWHACTCIHACMQACIHASMRMHACAYVYV